MGLNPASRTQSTLRPTTERVLAVFTSLTLTIISAAGRSYTYIT